MDVARLFRLSAILIVVLLAMIVGVIFLPPLVLRDAPAPTVLAPTSALPAPASARTSRACCPRTCDTSEVRAAPVEAQ